MISTGNEYSNNFIRKVLSDVRQITILGGASKFWSRKIKPVFLNLTLYTNKLLAKQFERVKPLETMLWRVSIDKSSQHGAVVITIEENGSWFTVQKKEFGAGPRAAISKQHATEALQTVSRKEEQQERAGLRPMS